MNIYKIINEDPFLRGQICSAVGVYGVHAKHRQLKHVLAEAATIRGHPVLHPQKVFDYYVDDPEKKNVSLSDFFTLHPNIKMGVHWPEELFSVDTLLHFGPKQIKFADTTVTFTPGELLLNPFGVNVAFANPIVFESIADALEIIAHVILDTERRRAAELTDLRTEYCLLYVKHANNIYEIYLSLDGSDGTYFLSADKMLGKKKPKRYDATSRCWMGKKRILLPLIKQRRSLMPLKICDHPACNHQFPEHYFSDICGAHSERLLAHY
jgi:hypothetical protein